MRKCKRLKKLDAVDITQIDWDVAKQYENESMESDFVRPNTSVGISHHKNHMEELFPSEITPDDAIDFSESQVNIISDTTTTNTKLENLTEEGVHHLEEIQDTKPIIIDEKNNINIADQKETILENKNKKISSNFDENKIHKNETLSNFPIRDKIISKVEYVPKNANNYNYKSSSNKNNNYNNKVNKFFIFFRQTKKIIKRKVEALIIQIKLVKMLTLLGIQY